MAVKSFSDEIPSKVAPNRLFKALIMDPNFLPSTLPQFFKSGEILEGNGGPGSIKQITFQDDAPGTKYMKHRIDELDEASFMCKYTLIEGGELNETITSIAFEIKLEATEGGSVAKMKRDFHLKEGAEIHETELDAQKEMGLKVYQMIEAYLLENPSVYA